MNSPEPVATTAKTIHRELQQPQQFDPLSFVPLLAGLYWLTAHGGGAWLIWALVPGGLLFATGVSQLLWPGESRVTALMSLGGAIGILLLPVVLLIEGFGTALLTTVGSGLSMLAAARMGLKREPLYQGAPAPEYNTVLDAKVALDEAVLGYFLAGARIPSGEAAAQTSRDTLALEKTLRERGYLADPSLMHRAPPPPEGVTWDRGRIFGHDYEVMRFESGYEAPAELPGAAKWKDFRANRNCSVRVLRHPGPPRPWLLCIHGYRMGVPWLDMSLFAPSWLHERLGLNILMPVLPLHGPRREGLLSGDLFLDGDIADLTFAESQSLWDLRRTLAWLRREEPAARVGVFGFSLGGYNASLLAAYETALDFVIAGIPAIDFAELLWRHMPQGHRNYFATQGINESLYRSMLTVVSPLARQPALAREHLHIFSGTGDRLVPPSQPLLLSQHWGVPVSWYQGAHLSVRREPETRATLKEAMRRAGWVAR